MPVNTPHSRYTEFIDQWIRCRDVHSGSDAVKGKRTAYLPMLEGMSATASAAITIGVDPVDPVTGGILPSLVTGSAYDNYLARAMFYPAMSRTVLGLVGLLFGKPPTPPKVSDTIKKQFDDVTLTGASLHGFAIEMAREILITGRVGALIDYAAEPRTPEEDRPYWLIYTAEDIFNWKVERIGGRMLLTQIVLREIVEDLKPGDEFTPEPKVRFRVLRLRNGNTYTVQLYEENPEKKNDYIGRQEITPVRRGTPLNFIPFQFVGPTGLEPTPEHPPLVDLADVDLSHYRTSADREHGAHFTALPTPWVSGHTLGVGEKLGVGAGTAWVFPNENAKSGMLEFSGAGLAALKDIMEEKRLLMATLGARMLETQKNVQEAAQTVAMRHAGEGSALGILADTLSKALTNLARWHLFWTGQEFASFGEDHIVTLNPELLEQLTAEDITALTALWQAGGISKKTLYYNLQWGEWTRPDVDFEDEQADIDDEEEEEEPPVIPGAVPPVDPNNPQPPVIGAAQE